MLFLSYNLLKSLISMDLPLFEQSERHYRMQLPTQSHVLPEWSALLSDVYRMAHFRSNCKDILVDRLLDGAACCHGVTAFGSDNSHDDYEAGARD